MKIKIDDKTMVNLKEIKEDIEKLLEMETKEMEVTEENLKKAKKILDRLYKIGNLTFGIRGMALKLETFDGTELTII